MADAGWISKYAFHNNALAADTIGRQAMADGYINNAKVASDAAIAASKIAGGTIASGGWAIGSSSSRLTTTFDGAKSLQVYTTCASTDASTSHEPQRFDNVLTGAGQVGGRFRVNMSTDVQLGSWANAFKAQAELNATGGVTGLLSVACLELVLPTGAGTGTLSCLELEMTAPSSGYVGTGQNPSYIFFNTTGTTKEGFNDYGVLFHFDAGNVAATGNIVGANYSTLRIGFEQQYATLRYIPLSTAEGTFTTAKPIVSTSTLGIGTSGSPVSYTAGSPVFTLYATSSNATSTNAQPFLVKSVLTGAGGYGGRSLFWTYTNVASGTNIMPLKTYMEYGDSGSTSGFSTALCTELQMPNASVNGSYYAIEVEYVAGGTSTTTQGSLGNSDAGFIYMGNSGDADGDFDANGFLFRIGGLTSGSTKLLYNNTLRMGIGSTTWYMPLSSAEASYTTAYPIVSSNTMALTVGTTGSRISLTTADTKAIRIYTTTAVATATQISSVEINQYRTADNSANGRDWALKVNLSSDSKYPSGANAIYGSMTFAAGGVHGRGAALQGEIILPDAQITRGTISCATLEMTQSANTNSASSGPVSFISCVAAGTLTDLDARGYLFEISGISEGDGKFCDNGATPTSADGGIRCLINGNVRYLLYANDAEN